MSDDTLIGVTMAMVDAFRTVNALAQMRGYATPPVNWRFLGADGRPRNRAAGMRGQSAPGAPAGKRVLIAPGWHARNGPHLDSLVRRDGAFGAPLKRAHAAGALVIGIYTGVALLAAAGLLKRRRAAVPWPFIRSALRHETDIDLVDDRPWIDDAGIVTCDTPTLATEIALHAVVWAGAAELADSAHHVLVHSGERQSTSRQIAEQQRDRPVTAGMLERATRWMQDNLQRPCRLADIARAAATSERTLLRHFRASYSITPLRYLQGLRAGRAKVLLETTYLPVDAVAELCGYRDTPMFRRVFQRATGLNPAAYRERYRLRVSRKLWGRELGGG